MEFTRADLIERNADEYAALLAQIEGLDPADRHREFAPGPRDRDVRDVLSHLHAWHLLLEGWVREGIEGRMPDIPAPGYTWRELAELNESLRLQWRETRLDEMRALTDLSHERLQELTAAFDDAELTDPEAFAWTRGSQLGEFVLECGGNHYAWARRAIDAGLGREP